MNDKNPALGQDVHYVSQGSANGVYPSTCRAAKVTELDCNPDATPEPGQVFTSLVVFNPEGFHFNSIRVQDRENFTPGSWHYPEDCHVPDNIENEKKPDPVQDILRKLEEAAAKSMESGLGGLSEFRFINPILWADLVPKVSKGGARPEPCCGGACQGDGARTASDARDEQVVDFGVKRLPEDAVEVEVEVEVEDELCDVTVIDSNGKSHTVQDCAGFNAEVLSGLVIVSVYEQDGSTIAVFFNPVGAIKAGPKPPSAD